MKKLLSAVLIGWTLSAGAQPVTNFPTKPIQLVVGLPPGTEPEMVARKLALGMGQVLGQPVVVINKPGASGLLAMEQVATAAPDGYTIGLGFPANMAASPLLYQRPRYNVETGLAPIGMIVKAPWVFYASTKLPVNSFAEFVALAKSRPDTLTYASTGIGSTQHLSMELLQGITGMKLRHIPYGATNFFPDLLVGTVDSTVWGLGNLADQVRSGKLKALGIANGRTRSELLPDTPTFHEMGIPSFDVRTWLGIVAPASTPADVRDRLSAALVKVVKSPEFQEAARSQGQTADGGTQQEFADFLAAERAMWKRVIAAGNIRLDK